MRRRWFQGQPIHGTDVDDIGWFKPDGTQMTDEDWDQGFANSLGVFLNGRAIPSLDARGERIIDDSFYLLFNAWNDALTFTIPTGPWGDRWRLELDTSQPFPHGDGPVFQAGESIDVEALSFTLLRRLRQEE